MKSPDATSALAFLQSSSLPMLMQEEIERLIMTGELAVGTRINESELALRFNTSRGPIREALRAKARAVAHSAVESRRMPLLEFIGSSCVGRNWIADSCPSAS